MIVSYLFAVKLYDSTGIIALRDEYDRGEGDLEITCAGNEKVICHSCIVDCQSQIMRRSTIRKTVDGLHLQRAQLR